MTTLAFTQKTLAVTAYLPLIIHRHAVCTMVAYHIVDSVIQELDSTAFNEFVCFCQHRVIAGSVAHDCSSKVSAVADKSRAVH